jgi:heme-degrading monooxygenase HmoA
VIHKFTLQQFEYGYYRDNSPSIQSKKVTSNPVLSPYPRTQNPSPESPHPRKQKCKMISDLTMANNICEWITITAPNTIHDSKSSTGQAWLAALQALVTREKCDGFQNCYWSRVTEDDTQLFIWTSWANKTAQDLYADGDAHRLVYEQLYQVSSTPVVTQLIMYDSTVPYAPVGFLLYWPSLSILYFDRPLTESRWARA